MLQYLLDDKFNTDRKRSILYLALTSKQTFIINLGLQLIKLICMWGDFVSDIYENTEIMRQVFYFCNQDDVLQLKIEAIYVLCNIVDEYFSDQ